jgi:ankyrin repeat protein
VVRLLLNEETARNAATERNGAGRLPLHEAACNGNAAVVRLLVDAAPETAKAALPDGRTPLHLAAQQGRADACPVLAAAAPSTPAVADAKGWVPMHYAARGGHADTVRQLIEVARGTALAERPADRVRPLHLAAFSGNAVACRLLAAVDRIALRRAATQKAYRPLHFAAGSGSAVACRVLLEADRAAALDFDAEGRTPLHLAAQEGNAEACAVLAEACEASVMAIEGGGRLALQLALVAGHAGRQWDAARCLLAHGPVELVLSQLRLPVRMPNATRALTTQHVAVRHALVADLIACRAPSRHPQQPHHPPLSADAWALVPKPCPGLLRALPTALAHGPSQAQQLVRRLPPTERRHLHTVLWCLHHLQHRHDLADGPFEMIRDMAFAK